jgi:hypothetical protein
MAKRANPPLSQRDGLVIQSIGEELIVYDPETHKAHSLNRPAAAVFRQVDGKTPVAEIVGKLGKEFRGAPAERVVQVALDRLGAAGLLTPAVNPRRRAVMRGLALLLPVVTSVVVPKPAAAASCARIGYTCHNPTTPCCAGTCFTAPYPHCAYG